MALAFTLLTSGSDTTTHPSTTASINPTSGAVVYALVAIAVAGGGVIETTDSLAISGAGLTWTTLGSAGENASNRRKIFAVKGTGTPSSGALTITFSPGGGASWTETAWHIVEATGLDGTTNNGAMFTNVTAGATALSVTISETPDAGDAVLAAFTIESTGTSPALNGELSTQVALFDAGTDIRALLSAYDSSPDSNPAPGITWTGANSATGIAFIVNAAAGGGATSITKKAATYYRMMRNR